MAFLTRLFALLQRLPESLRRVGSIDLLLVSSLPHRARQVSPAGHVRNGDVRKDSQEPEVSGLEIDSYISQLQ